MNPSRGFILVLNFLMRLISKFKYLYLFILIIYTVFYAFFKAKPQLKSITIKESSTRLFSQTSKNNLLRKKLDPLNNRINVGKSFFIQDKQNWYQVIQLSFWKKEYFNLDFLNNQLNINDINIKRINNNNYALGTLQGEKIVYSCMKNSKSFIYRTFPKRVVNSFEIHHWKTVFINNINLVFYSFKPRNYECYVVITPHTNFFDNSEFYIDKKIFNNFIYK